MIFGNRSTPNRFKNFPVISNILRREPENAPSYAAQLMTMEPFGSTPRAKSKELADLYNKSPWVRSIVGKIATSVASQKWYFENSAGERVDAHPALTFLKAGSPLLRGKNSLKVTSALIDLTGEAFWIIGRDARGVPVQWAPIPTNWVIDTPTSSFNGYRVQSRPGHVVELKVQDVMWLRDPDPVDPYTRGSSLTGAAQTEIGADEAAADMLGAFFRNRAKPDIIITGTNEHNINEQSRPAFEASWLEKFRGAGKAFRPFFSSKPLEIHQLTSGLKDVETGDIRELGRKIIQEFYGVPPEIFGRLESSNKATIGEARNLYGRYTLDPRLSFLQDEIEPWLADEFNTAGLTLRYESPIEEDTAFALEVFKARPSAFSNDEVRALAKLKPLGGKHANVFDPQDPNDIGDEDPDDEGPGGGKPNEETPDDEKSVDVVPTTKAVNLDDAINVSSAHEDPQVKAEVTRLMDELFVELLNKIGSETLEALGAEANFQAAARTAEFIAEEVPDLIGRIDETTRKELRASLAEGVAENENVAALIKRVDRVFEEASKIRASTIGDTIATKITGFASQVAAEEAGFSRKKWLSTRDQLVRGTHASLDGQVVPTNGKFKSASGAEAAHPGSFGVASEDVNCRCAMRPMIDGEVRAAVTSDAEYVAFHVKTWNRTAKRVKRRVDDIFAAQREVVVAALERANRT